MKLKQLLILVISLISFTSYAQSESITPKYGVVDLDSIIMSIPETKVLYQRVDSVQNEAYKAMEPLALQLQEKENQYREAFFSGDTIAISNINADAQLLQQELNLIEQKAHRAIRGYQQDLSKILEDIKANVTKVGERMQLTFIMPKQEHPIYTSLEFPLIFESPYYYSGEAVDVTGDVLKEVLPPKEPAKSTASTKPKTNKPK